MQFTDIPREVIDDSLLKYLGWNDLLRLRRVCSWTKGIADAYLRVNPSRAPEIEINEDDKTLKAFIDMGIPTEKLFLNNQSAYSFYEQMDEEIGQQFLEHYGPIIKQLRVTRLTLFVFGKELDFINGFKNITSFETGYFGPGRIEDDDMMSDDTRALLKKAMSGVESCIYRFLPTVFKSLEAVKIGLPDDFVKEIDIVKRGWDIWCTCPQLKYACLPFNSVFNGEPGEESLIERALPKALNCLAIYITKRPNDMFPSSDNNGRLEFFDFQNFHRTNFPLTVETLDESMDESFDELRVRWVGSQYFLRVCSRALETGLKLLNVDPTWYCARFDAGLISPDLGIPVISLVGLDPCAMDLDMPNLEKITIPQTSCCIVPGEELTMRPTWPALKSLDITVDGKNGAMWDVVRKSRFEDVARVIRKPTCLLYKFLFGNGVVHANMSDMSIQFVEGKRKAQLAVPKIEHIVASCPNLKKIKLGNWMGTNKALVEMWEGLERLEEICLENCKELGNVAFVGVDVEYPVFFGLENLKKLTLVGLDKMPKITDTLFTLVLSKMKLKELALTSADPVKTVTKKGINALLEGPFAESIERFSFQDWSVADMTAEEFQEMGKKFRSYDMI